MWRNRGFIIRKGVHQGSALSCYLFLTVINGVTKEIQSELPWFMIFADGIVLIGKNRTEVYQTR